MNNIEKSKADFTVREIYFANISNGTVFLLQGVWKLTLWQNTLRSKTLVCDLQEKRCLIKEIKQGVNKGNVEKIVCWSVRNVYT